MYWILCHFCDVLDLLSDRAISNSLALLDSKNLAYQKRVQFLTALTWRSSYQRAFEILLFLEIGSKSTSHLFQSYIFLQSFRRSSNRVSCVSRWSCLRDCCAQAVTSRDFAPKSTNTNCMSLESAPASLIRSTRETFWILETVQFISQLELFLACDQTCMWHSLAVWLSEIDTFWEKSFAQTVDLHFRKQFR